MAGYEFFREKAWQGMHCLKHFAETEKQRYTWLLLHAYCCDPQIILCNTFFENLRNITWILLNQANAIYIWFFNSSESKLLGEKLRAIGDELIRSADILEGKIDDTIHVFNEQVGKMEKDIESKNLQKSNRQSND